MITLGDKNIKNIYLGDKPVTQVYLGELPLINNTEEDYTEVVMQANGREHEHIFKGMTAINPSEPIVIDWGDGNTTENEKSHTYSDELPHTVKIYNCANFNNYVPNGSTAEAQRQKYLITELIKADKRLTSMASICANAKFLKRIAGTFIPQSGVTDVTQAFYYCENLSVIEEGFTLEYTKAANGYAIFNHDSKITSMPKSFKLPPTMSQLIIAFEGCVEMVTLGGFRLSSGVTAFNGVCYNCKKLADKVEDLFPLTAFTGKSINASIAFNGCSNLIGTAPADILWEGGKGIFSSTADCFKGCLKITNYNEIPKSWGGGKDEVPSGSLTVSGTSTLEINADGVYTLRAGQTEVWECTIGGVNHYIRKNNMRIWVIDRATAIPGAPGRGDYRRNSAGDLTKPDGSSEVWRNDDFVIENMKVVRNQ